MRHEVEPLWPDEALAGRLGHLDPRDAIRSDVVVDLGDEIPGSALEDEPERFHGPFDRFLSRVPPIDHPDLSDLPDGCRQELEIGHVVGFLEPARRVEVEPLGHPSSPCP